MNNRVFNQSGIKIDKTKKRYRKYISLLFFDINDEWQNLPDVAFVSFTRVKGGQTFNSSKTMGNSSTSKINLYCVYFCEDVKKKKMILKTKDKEEAYFFAYSSAKYLGVELKKYVNRN